MKVKDLIFELLDCDLNKEISIVYPNNAGHIVGNYCRYEETENFTIKEYEYGIIIGAGDED